MTMTASRFDPADAGNRLQQPPRTRGRREPDRAICIDDAGHEHELVSGPHDMLYQLAVRRLRERGYVHQKHIPEIAAHVETKAALWMQEDPSRVAKLIIGGPPCVGPLSCETVLSGLVPAWPPLPTPAVERYAVVAYWRHAHGDAPVVAHTAADIDELVDRLLAEPFDHSVATVYAIGRPLNKLGLPDHELRVAIDATSQVGALRYMGGAGTWYSHGPRNHLGSQCYHHMGWAAPFPPDSALPLAQIRAALAEFHGSAGRRPVCAKWQHVGSAST
jgi:hypothetical protein